MSEPIPPTTQRRAGSVALFWVATALTALAFGWLYLDRILTVKDLNPEAMGTMLIAGHLEKAREKGVSSKVYLQSEACLEDMKKEDPRGSFDYPRGLFHFEWQAYSQALLMALHAPFVKLIGVNVKSVMVYAALFCALTCVATGLMAGRMFGRWGGLLAVALLLSSLSWLLHTRHGYPEHMTSALMMCGAAWLVFDYMRSGKRGTVVLMGVLLGLMYCEGWIAVVFGAIMVGLAIALGGSRRITAVLLDGITVFAAAAVTAAVFTLGFALYNHCDWLEVNQRIWDVMFSRFSQGSAPAFNPSFGGKLAYAFRCLFWDMETVDHRDKCLEGHGAVPLVFAALCAVGLLYAIKERRAADRTLLVWALSVFGLLGSFYLFQHRYAVLGLPALAILAARGVSGIGDDLWRWRGAAARRAMAAAAALLVVGSLAWTHRLYAVDYSLNKVPEFETDRVRGHGHFAEWLQANSSPQDTLVVLNDPIMFPRVCFHFYTFGRGYRFVYWSNHFNTVSTPEQVLAWEKEQLTRYPRIVYAFSSQLLGDNQGRVTNDWRPFLAAHPAVQPAWSYSYVGRPVSIVAFGVMRSPGT